MAPPPQQQCTAPGCDYVTPENIPTWDLVIKQQEIHLKSKHPDPVQQDATPGGGGKIFSFVSPQISKSNMRHKISLYLCQIMSDWMNEELFMIKTIYESAQTEYKWP